MKTWIAALAHIGLGAAQAATGAMFFQPDTLGGALANTQIQLGAQSIFIALQTWIAKKNSNTNPDATPATQPYKPLLPPTQVQ